MPLTVNPSSAKLRLIWSALHTVSATFSVTNKLQMLLHRGTDCRLQELLDGPLMTTLISWKYRYTSTELSKVQQFRLSVQSMWFGRDALSLYSQGCKSKLALTQTGTDTNTFQLLQCISAQKELMLT